MPGAGGAGIPGAGPGRQGGAADLNLPEGAAEAFLDALVSQNKDSLAKLISSKASGELGQIRKGTSDGRNLAKSYGALKVVKVGPITRGDERIVVLGEGSADSKNRKQMVLRKEDGGWKVFYVPPATK